MTTVRQDNENETMLAIDTSTSALTVALSVNGRIAGQRSSKAERNHSIRLLPEIEELLGEAGLSPSALDAVAVGTGPGSYTGVRIGVTVAKTFAWSLGIPVIGVSGLEALALGDAGSAAAADVDAGDADRPAWYVPLLDARRGQAFCGVYASGPDGWSAVETDAIRPLGPWLDALADRLAKEREQGRGPERLVFGGETEGFRETIEAQESSWPAGIEKVIRTSEIQAAQIAELARRRIGRGERDDMHGLVPNYTQLAEAEVKLLQKQKRGDEPFGVC